uniref:RTX toxin-activating lysine-acyltransferase n=1 Tax=Candidatus Kentrum sp. LPFa TaxID=2126335 RepID=A0A450VPN0_9GAMM|nr:MAG: cytolysin-activating lysine-acyltransferase [Candidatus Kentron sp. LPFa]
MYFDNLKLDVIAPIFIQQRWTEAKVLGGAVWLWMNSENHHELPLHTLSVALLPAIKTRQFVLAAESGRPVFFMSWANLSTEAETRYLSTHQLLMSPEDWQSGDRMWVIDWVAPFGHTKKMKSFVLQRFMAGLCFRSLYHRGEERGRRIQYFFGALVSPQERRAWKAAHPIAYPSVQ